MADFIITGGKPKAFFLNGGKAKQVYLAGAALLSAGFSITCDVEHGTYTGPATIEQGGTATLIIAPTSPYVLPSAITVVGADYTYSDTTGEIVLSNPTGNVSVSVVCAVAYNLTVSVTNGSADITTGYVAQGGSRTITLSANENCTLPSSVTVSNASYTYDNATGTIVVSNPTGDVTVSARCRTATWDGVTYAGTKWKFKSGLSSYALPWSSYPTSTQYPSVAGTFYDTDGVTLLQGASVSARYFRRSWNSTNSLGWSVTVYGGTWQLGIRTVNGVMSYLTFEYNGSLYNSLQNLYFKFSDNQGTMPALFTDGLKALATIVDW